MANTAAEIRTLLACFGNTTPIDAGDLCVRSPIDGAHLANLPVSKPAEVDAAVAVAHAAFHAWRRVPAPRRGELVRQFGEALRRHKTELAELVTIESGKIRSEAMGEIQEMIDICDFAVGLSRQLYGLTIASERPLHRLMETWHPLGVCGVITAFNFPVAVWAWNAALALVCGDPVVWKPSEKTPLTALACQALLAGVAAQFPEAPAGLSSVLLGGSTVGTTLADNPSVALVSATGSTAMGRAIAPRVASRFGRCILELGGNNGMIVTPSADLDLALRAIVFAAAGTAGQRCTSLRRLFVHESVAPALLPRIVSAYESLVVGDPRNDGVLIGPLIDAMAFSAHQAALAEAVADGGKIHGGERVAVRGAAGGFHVRPALVEMPCQTPLMMRETFAPILYVVTYRDIDAAIELHNAVSQGLASAIFTNDLREMELFLSSCGSDCGIANVNAGPSGAEIGGAFGGEKASGGGREAGSDAWKAYMRRATNTINYSRELPLAQGVKFI